MKIWKLEFDKKLKRSWNNLRIEIDREKKQRSRVADSAAWLMLPLLLLLLRMMRRQ